MDTYPQPPLSPEQRSNMASQIQYSAYLLTNGAEIAPDGRLEVSAKQNQDLYYENIQNPLVKEFMRSTVDGITIAAHQDALGQFNQAIHGHMGNTVFDLRPIIAGDPSSTPGVTDFRAWSEKNRIDIDFDKIESGSTAEHEKALSVGSRCMSALDELAVGLVENPQFRIGGKVGVLRNAKEGRQAYIESGWTVNTILANGKLQLINADGTLTKSATLRELQTWNQ